MSELKACFGDERYNRLLNSSKGLVMFRFIEVSEMSKEDILVSWMFERETLLSQLEMARSSSKFQQEISEARIKNLKSNEHRQP